MGGGETAVTIWSATSEAPSKIFGGAFLRAAFTTSKTIRGKIRAREEIAQP
jgi:hypothetical protein